MGRTGTRRGGAARCVQAPETVIVKATCIMAWLALGAGIGLTPCEARAQQAGITRTDLQRHDLSTPGREIIQVRVDFPSGAAFGKHSHPGEEIVYVIEGVLEYQLEDQPPVTLRTGEVLF